ncbi:MAG: histidinol-phosphate transaminase [Deltaproteobacteria bacterium]|nr:histidinol-phosphate transaminase [Deltaproteobacteria bacterium]
MKPIVRPGVADLVPYPPGKPIEELERELGISGSIKLASNENPLGPSPKALEAIKDNLHALNRYPDGSGYYLKTRLSRHYGIPLERIILGNGSNELIELAVRAFLSEGDDAVQHFPAFLVYEKVVTGAGGHMISVPISDFRIDLQELGQALTPRTRIVFITNPNNPTGSVLSKEALAAFLKEVPDDLIVLLDEAYIEFVTDPAAARGLDLFDAHPLLFVVRTFSKLYGLAGLRIGYGFGSADVIDYMNRVRQPFNVNSLAQAAAIGALDDEEFVSDTLRIVKEGLDYLCARLVEMGLDAVPTQTNFFLIRVPHGGKRVYRAMLKEGVIIRAMDGYGLPDYIRINAGLPEENERFIKALKKVLADLSAAGD